MNLFQVASSANIILKAVYIPSKLNTTADLLSRFVYGAHNSDYALRHSIFRAIGGYRCNTIAFADPQGQTAAYLLSPKKGTYLYYSTIKSAFLHAK